MLTSILGARLSWHFANGWVFEPRWIARRHGVANAERVVSSMGAALNAMARTAADAR
jgi:hypothetical protein